MFNWRTPATIPQFCSHIDIYRKLVLYNKDSNKLNSTWRLQDPSHIMLWIMHTSYSTIKRNRLNDDLPQWQRYPCSCLFLSLALFCCSCPYIITSNCPAWRGLRLSALSNDFQFNFFIRILIKKRKPIVEVDKRTRNSERERERE